MLIKDSYKLTLPDDSKLKDALKAGMIEIKDAHGIPGLELIIDATHGGYVNSNYTFYKKEGQMSAAKTWFTPYPKPALVEHDDTRSAVGRVLDAQYVDLPVTADEITKAGKKGVPQSKITLKAIVTDPDAVQKLLDGRYLTVSISGRPKSAPKCSICDEVVDGPFGCEDGHVRGKEYDGKLAYYIVDEMIYSEVSFVNKPADQSDTHVAAVTSVKAVQAPSLTSGVREAMEEALKAVAGKDFATAGAISDSQDEKVEPETEDKFWSPEERKELDIIADEFNKFLESDEAKDAKLSAEQRKGLKSSTFCGPNRSFPVPDCKHVTAARRLIGRAKVSDATKSKILSCVARKAKGLGCGGDSESDTITIKEAMAIMEEAKKILESQVEVLVEQKKDAEKQLSEANTNIEKMISDLNKAQEDLKKVQGQVFAAESQHATDLTQNKDLTQKVKDSVSKAIILEAILLKKDSVAKAFSGSKAEDRVTSFQGKIQEFKDMTLDEITNKEKQLFDELSKVTILTTDMMGLEGSAGDQKITEIVKTHTTRKNLLTNWWENGDQA